MAGTFRFPTLSITPSAPPAGYDLVYFKTDDILYRLNSSGIETSIGPVTFNEISPMTTTGDMIYDNGSGAARLPIGSSGQFLTVIGGVPTWQTDTGTGTVTSVAFSDTSTSPIYSITGSPITAAGTISIALTNQTANKVLAGPSSGSAAQPTFRTLTASDIPSLSATYVLQSEVAVANGVASLDSGGKVPVSQLPNTVFEYLGAWNASTNTPTISDGTGTSGNVYRVSVGGTQNLGSGPITFQVGDLVIHNGIIWQDSPAADGVSSVNGMTGAVVVNAINQLIGDVTTAAASGSQSETSTISNGAVTAAKLGSVADGLTLDQSGSGSTLEVKVGGISNTQVNASAGIVYSKLSLSNSILNADINSSAAIAYSKLNLATSVQASDMNSGVATSGQVLTANGTGGATYVTSASGSGITQLTGNVTAGPGSGSQVASITSNAVTNAMLAQMASDTVKANITGSLANASDVSLVSTNTANSVALRDSSGNSAFQNITANQVNGATSGATLALVGGTAASNASGGQITINGATGSNVGTGGNGGSVTINGGSANGNNTANQSGGAISISGGTSFGSGTGGTVTINSGTGGPGTGTAGATGGTTNINGGNGGIGSSTSGNGGGFTGKAGSGGAGVAGGTGGTAQITGGTGGTGSSTSGNGGAANVQGGSPASAAGSAGGAVNIDGGNGSGTGSGGAGGSITIATGTAGGDNTVNNSGGSLTMTVGHSMGSAGGNQVTITAGTGGVGSGTAGANGGNTNINAGTGGAGSSSGGNGGNVVISAGAGGSSTSNGTGGIIQFEVAATTSVAERMRVTSTEVYVSNAQLEVKTAGFGFGISHGSNCKLGTSTLSAGTVTVSNTAVTSNSIIFLTIQSNSGTLGSVYISAKVPGTSFTITSTSALDTSTVGWLIVEGL